MGQSISKIGGNTLADIKFREQVKKLDSKVDSFDSQIKDKANQIDLEVERKRIDSFTSLAEGSTTGDAELIDGRIGNDGTVYDNIGGAIRGQTNKLNVSLENIVKNISEDTSNIINSDTTFYDGKYIAPTTGGLASNTEYSSSQFIKIESDTSYYIECTEDLLGAFFDENKTYISGIKYQQIDKVSEIITTPVNAKYIRLSCKTKYLSDLICKKYFDFSLNKEIKIEKSQIKDFNEKKVTVLEVGNGKQYSSLRSAIESCINPSEYNQYVIKYYNENNGVEYDIAKDITSEELADSNFVGLYIPKYTKLVGVGGKEKCIFALRLDKASNMISALNLYSSSSLEGITVIGNKTRYTIHDDFKDVDCIRSIKNCKFISEKSEYFSVWGGGCREGEEAYFENCEFITEVEGETAFSMHNNRGMTHPARFYITNCSFSAPNNVTFQTLGNNTFKTINELYLYGCKVGKLSLIEQDAVNYGGGCLWKVSGYGNDIKTVDIITTDGKDYSSYIDLI